MPRWFDALGSRLNRMSSLVITLLAVVSALVVGAVIIILSDVERLGNGEIGAAFSELATAYSALVRGSVGSLRALSETVNNSTPFIIAGVSVALAFKTGLFNIGATGQMLAGGLATTWVGFVMDGPAIVQIPLALLAGLVGGALFGAIPGVLKARTGAHEVITTIMLNYIASFTILWALDTQLFQRPDRSDPISKFVSDEAMLPKVFGFIGLGEKFPAHSGIIVARYLGASAGTGGTPTAGTGTATGYTLHTFTTTGASTLTLSTLSTTLSGAITGTGNLTTVATGGTIILTGANTYDGTTTIPGGTVRVGAGGATGSLGTGAITNNGALIFNRTGTLTVAGAIDGTGTLEQAGTGTTVLDGVNTYSGATTVSAGTLAVTDDAGLGTTAAGTTVASGASLDLRDALVGAETLALNGGTLMASTGTSTLTGAVTLGASSTLSVAGTQLTLGGIISGATFGLTKTGAGVAILTGANTFTGPLPVNGGTLRIGGAGRLAAGTYVEAITVASGATFDYASSANQIFGTNGAAAASNTLRGAGNFLFGGSGTLTLRGDFSATGTVEVSQAVTMTGGSNGPNTALGQTAGIDIKSGGTITLAGSPNSFTGTTTSSVLTIRTGGKLTTDGSSGQTFHLGAITLAGGEIATGAGATTTVWGIYNFDRTITVTEDSTISAQFSA
ncbi:MAG: hypothetical protein EBV77_08780, partial [Gemmatimonadaceae bacterium]|nr:hypothetical protein [Gemmatimonadaceae bacterium]